MRLSPQRQREIEEVLEHTASGKDEDLMIFKHISPSLLRLWLVESLGEIRSLRTKLKGEDETRKVEEQE